jgi:hypothetical protein
MISRQHERRRIAPDNNRVVKHRPSAFSITSAFTPTQSIFETHAPEISSPSDHNHLNIPTMEGHLDQYTSTMEGHLHQHNPPIIANRLQHYEIHTFKDFLNSDPYATFPVLGERCTLDALNTVLSAGFHMQPVNLHNQYPAYTPLAIALNTICAEMNMPFVTEVDLYNMQFMPWYQSFAKEFIRVHHAQHLFNINNFINAQGSFTEDHMVLCIAAFAYSRGCGSVGLGIVTLVKGEPVQAFHYPSTNTIPDYTAWIVADFRTEEHVFYGIGHKVDLEQCVPARAEEDLEHNGDITDDEDILVPLTTPRKTATRVLLQQTPLPATLTADDILQNHKSRLQYNNILKVALSFSNQTIWEECKSESLPKNERLKIASAIVKRIGTAVRWIEDQYDIDTDAFRTAFDRERRTNDINTRVKDQVSNGVIAASSSKIAAAMAWIRSGGPRPDSGHTPQGPTVATDATASFPAVPPGFDSAP